MKILLASAAAAGLYMAVISAPSLSSVFYDLTPENRDLAYRNSLSKYHFLAHDRNGHPLIDEYGYNLRFDSESAADTYAVEYARVP